MSEQRGRVRSEASRKRVRIVIAGEKIVARPPPRTRVHLGTDRITKLDTEIDAHRTMLSSRCGT